MMSLEAELVERPRESLVSSNVNIATWKFISNERVVFMLLLSTLWTLILTVIPVLTSLPPDDYYLPERKWYSGGDVMRFVEPVGGLLLNCIVLYQAPIFHIPSFAPPSKQWDGIIALPQHWILLSIFALSLAIYQQGAGFHSASNMFKNALQTIIDSEGDDTVYDNLLHKLYFYMRTVWEHDVSHYLYAVGLVGVQMCQLHAHWYRRGSDGRFTAGAIIQQQTASGNTTVNGNDNTLAITRDDSSSENLGRDGNGLVQPSRFTLWTLFASALSYGVLIAAVAINYPAGLIVGLVYVLVLLAVIVISLFWESKSDPGDSQAFCFGYRPVVHHFAVGCLWAVLFIVIWIIINGGIVQRSNSSAIKS